MRADVKETSRNIILAVDLSRKSELAACWALHELYNAGDIFHIVHVAKILAPQVTIQHGYQANVDVQKSTVSEKELDAIRAEIKTRFTVRMDRFHAPHNLHFFVETDNAPGTAVAEIVYRVATEVGAKFIVVAAHNKEPSEETWSEYLLGSVAQACLARGAGDVAVSIVRGYEEPFIFPARRRDVVPFPYSPSAARRGSSGDLGSGGAPVEKTRTTISAASSVATSSKGLVIMEPDKSATREVDVVAEASSGNAFLRAQKSADPDADADRATIKGAMASSTLDLKPSLSKDSTSLNSNEFLSVNPPVPAQVDTPQRPRTASGVKTQHMANVNSSLIEMLRYA